MRPRAFRRQDRDQRGSGTRRGPEEGWRRLLPARLDLHRALEHCPSASRRATARARHQRGCTIDPPRRAINHPRRRRRRAAHAQTRCRGESPQTRKFAPADQERKSTTPIGTCMSIRDRRRAGHGTMTTPAARSEDGASRSLRKRGTARRRREETQLLTRRDADRPFREDSMN